MEPFKNSINLATATKIALAIKKHYLGFNQKAFLADIEKGLAPLELKERVAFIAEKLHAHLPIDPNVSFPLIVKAAESGLSGFTVWPLTHYIALYGLEHFDLSMDSLKELTKVFTSEFAVRPFFVLDELRALKYFKGCLKDPNEHVRRWVSEGSRPLLPWGLKLHSFVESPERTWSLLEKLKNDPSEYVRKSVANHVNDHSKKHPDWVIEKLLVWHQQKKNSDELSWVIRHASRSLIKKGFKKAFVLHGVEASKIKVTEHKILSKKIVLGGKLLVRVAFKNLSKSESKFIVDHEIHLLKANKSHLKKVFKGKKIVLAAGESIVMDLNIPLKPVTTRVYHSGLHHWNIIINGESSACESFHLSI